MRALRGVGWGLVGSNLIIGGVLTLTHPELTRTELLYAFWPTWASFAIGMLLLFTTERKGAL